MIESMLELTAVRRRFGDVIAVDDVSLKVRRSETVALLGPNGAGKTTLLEMVLGLCRPDRGAIRVLFPYLEAPEVLQRVLRSFLLAGASASRR